MKLIKREYLPYFVIFAACIIFYFPIFVNPGLFINRNNDLQEFFWPIYYFVKEQILINHQIPFWNNMILSGTPLLPDPQAPYFYLPNIIFLFLPINLGFILSAFFHIFVGGIGAYLVAKKILNLNNLAAVFCAILFVFSPKLAGYIEAGHFGLILSWNYLPWLFLSSVMLIKKPKLLWSFVLAISTAGLFYTHSTTFIYATLLSVVIFTILVFKSEDKIKSVFHYILGGIFSFGLSAIALLPQISWIPQTNRYLLGQNPQVRPMWNSKMEFIRQIILPLDTDSEKWIPLGVISLILALYGFIKTKNNYKFLLLVLILTVLIVSANNLTPFYNLLITQKWFDYLRVSTRIWFALNLTVIFLAAFGLQKMSGKLNKQKLVYIFFFLAVLELITLSWIRFGKEAPVINYAPNEVYEFLSKDNDKFRVFCLTRCISQKDSAIYHLELIDGYSTLIQNNYNSHAYQLTGTFWDYYSLSIPPIGSLSEKLQPNIKSLGEYNTKYIISPYELNNSNLFLSSKIEGYLIYRNKLYIPRAPVPILKYSPNYIKFDTSNNKKSPLVVSEVFNSDWTAFLNGSEKVMVQETPNRLRSINFSPEIKSVELKYLPKGYRSGKIITFLTVLIMSVFYLTRKYRKKA